MKVLKALVGEIMAYECPECDTYPQLPSVPKLCLTAEVYSNAIVTLDSMHHIIRGQQISTLVKIDSGELTVRLNSP